MFDRSAAVTFLICVIGVGICIGALFKIQIVKGEYYREQAASIQLDDKLVAAKRGVIYDANMNPLAQSTYAKKISIVPSLIGDDEKLRNIIVNKLSSILGMDKEKLLKKCMSTNLGYEEIKHNVDNETADKVREFMKKEYTKVSDNGAKTTTTYSSYISIDPDVKRYYSNPYFASAVLGFTGYDNTGMAGLESKYDTDLSGVPGHIVTAKNGGGKGRQMPIEYKSVHDATQGNSLVLTIDEYIQSYLESALSQAYTDTGCDTIVGIIMDSHTGAILGMATRGQGYYDLSSPYAVVDERAAEMLGKAAEENGSDPDEAVMYGQWKNIAISSTYEPGSVFKVITASALLEEDLVPLDETYDCVGSATVAGSLYNCHRHSGHGIQTIKDALKNSCNPFFITRGIRLGVDGFNKYFESFGFLERTGIDLPAESNSVFFATSKMTLSNVASASFGQTFNITPIQMLTAVNAVGNGGYLVKPYVVAKMLDEDGNVISETKPTVKRQVISKQTSETMRDMMENVVSTGTGKNAYVPGYRVAGKTGTSEKVTQTTESGISSTFWASFACFAPANDPEVSMIIVIDNPKGAHGGGAVAAPVAGETLSNVMEYLNVEPQYTSEELEKMQTTASNVVGLSPSEGRSRLSEEGFTVIVRGDGDEVLKQIPSGDQDVPTGGVIILYTSQGAEEETLTMPDLTGMTILQATNTANAAGINIKISGNSLLESELTAYKQSIEPGKEINYGTVVTVYFKSNMGVTDF